MPHVWGMWPRNVPRVHNPGDCGETEPSLATYVSRTCGIDGEDTSKVGASAYFIEQQPPHAWPVASLHHKCVHEFTGVPDPDPQKNSCKLWSSKIQRIRSRKSQSLAQKSTGKFIRTFGKIERIPSRRTWFFVHHDPGHRVEMRYNEPTPDQLPLNKNKPKHSRRTNQPTPTHKTISPKLPPTTPTNPAKQTVPTATSNPTVSPPQPQPIRR